MEIANGKLRGSRNNGTVSFKGIPYAADTGGANRFLAPRPVANWAGVRDAVRYGARCPQVAAPWVSGPPPAMSEDCCSINIFTPDLNPDARRPVMFWIHGGGFEAGCGEVDGANLAKFGDVVVVAVNHRLNVLGYTHLGSLDPAFADSANVGQLDLIAALQWVKVNIAHFGGDPGNVTVFGQSGGGSKIITMQLSPMSRGLFQRGINMSGTPSSLRTVGDGERVTHELLKALEIDQRDFRKLQDVPVSQLLAANLTALAKTNDLGARPMVDGRIILHQMQSPEGVAMQTSMPMIYSMTATEGAFFLAFDKRNQQVTADQLRSRIARQYQLDDARAREVIAGYTQDDPKRTPWDLLKVATSENWGRSGLHQAVAARAALRQAPVYMLDFNYLPDPVNGAIHTADIPYAFGDPVVGDRTYDMFYPDPSAAGKAVAANHMDTFVAFARTGNPNNPRIPTWHPYDLARRPTLVMEERPRVVDDFRSGDRKTSESLPLQDPFGAWKGPLFMAG
ncbi:carboxylesterase family protein [Sphingobium sp. H39-3-25]|uniref:carboxylesterase/lipase family protein n=1 Tax=Sphingobium arseniciresistens TaxID=3030834 RepID=UPI0023B901C9|nr:carboxylesterase family protein [Sphingobium arseniciresistens]